MALQNIYKELYTDVILKEGTGLFYNFPVFILFTILKKWSFKKPTKTLI